MHAPRRPRPRPPCRHLKERAETAETDLRLEPTDRRRLQVALTSLGFDTRGDDGVFGPRSREMIANWQKARNQPATGFVTKAQQQALLQEAAAALSKDDEQRKAKEDIPPAAEASAAPPPARRNRADGLWRGTYECGRNGNFKPFTLKPEVRLKAGNRDLVHGLCLGGERQHTRHQRRNRRNQGPCNASNHFQRRKYYQRRNRRHVTAVRLARRQRHPCEQQQVHDGAGAGRRPSPRCHRQPTDRCSE